MNTEPRILVVGFGRAGKDECGAFFDEHLGLRYCCSTSWAALPLMAQALGKSDQLVWESRHQNRQLWKDTLDAARKDNPALLIQRAFNRDPKGRVVTGVRDRAEIEAAKALGLFEHYLWIERVGIPIDTTVTFGPGDCTSLVRNDGSLRRFHKNIVQWCISVGLNPPKFSSYAAEVFEDLDP